MTDIIILGLIFCVCVFFVVIDLKVSNARFSDNGNIKKKYVKENLATDNLMQGVLDKMEELEKGSDSNVKNKRNNK